MPAVWLVPAETCSVAAAAAETVNEPESAVASAPSEKRSVFAPLASMRRLAKVATPELATAVTVPASEPVPVCSAAVTVDPSLVTVLPYASCTATTGCVPKAEPAVAPDGCVVTASAEAAAGETTNEPASAAVRAPSAKWSVFEPLLSIRRPVNVATPLSAAFVSVPCSGPVPEPRLTVTLDESLVTVLP